MVFRPDQDQPKFNLFPEVEKTFLDKLLIFFQLLALVLLVRLVMVMTGVMFFYIPIVDPLLSSLANWVIEFSK